MVSNTARLDYLRQFHELPQDDYDLFQAALKPRSFKRGERLVDPGHVQRELYLIRQGVQMSYFETAERQHVIAFTYPPDFCAIPGSFSRQQAAPYALVCLTDTDADCISYSALTALFDRSQHLERLFRRMTEAILAGLISRHIDLHAFSMEARYRAFCQRSGHLLQLVPHKYIASYLGIDATNFSKLYNQVPF
ncbi:Crp/Fnr family transcriptional regulator [Pedobacter yulinensis]|uniref:Crp/Fnr family transcriptional regulator n=1 Tax=Pedobacter yulinensis TaxID=2126353 RepID=A0A2T3HL16_9SPHI|nr:Crp/Fnr family transcriptional regulator [Pedobacter yulinensis]PST83142.1 Crp/Fnr family transcriptional regulator [Pedobacter yulinensis]